MDHRRFILYLESDRQTDMNHRRSFLTREQTCVEM